jgi:ribosomal protein S12 methylthiotransferase accessory factor
MDITVSFPGGKRVDAQAGAFTIRTDQPVDHGGDASAPEPFTLFLASLATCAGIYIVGFCRTRGIPTDDLELVQRAQSDPKSGRLTHVELEVRVPAGFPEQYRVAIARAAAACKVKKTLGDPPTFEVKTTVRATVGTSAEAGAARHDAG